MDRLTSKRVNGIRQGFWSPAKKEDLCQRLGAYEETGLTPEEIEELKRRTMIIHDAANEQPGVKTAGVLMGYVLEAWLTFEDGSKKPIYDWERVSYFDRIWRGEEYQIPERVEVRYWVELPQL